MDDKSPRLCEADRQLRILIADPRRLFRASLKLTIEKIDRQFDVLETDDISDISSDSADLVLLPIDPQRSADLERLQVLRNRAADTPVVVFSDADSAENVLLALRSGARGYIPTTLESRIMVDALRLVAAGGTYIPDVVVDMLHALATGEPAAIDATSSDNAFQTITPRQREVLDSLRQGMPNKLIAHQLGISENTVKAHLSQIMKKLNVRNRTEAVLLASGLSARLVAEHRSAGLGRATQH